MASRSSPIIQTVHLAKWDDRHAYANRQGWLFRGQRFADWQLTTSLERCCERLAIEPKLRRTIEDRVIREFRPARTGVTSSGSVAISGTVKVRSVSVVERQSLIHTRSNWLKLRFHQKTELAFSNWNSEIPGSRKFRTAGSRTVSVFEATGFVLAEHRRVQQVNATSLSEFAKRTLRRADTALALISDSGFRKGQLAIERAAAHERIPSPVMEVIELLVFQSAA